MLHFGKLYFGMLYFGKLYFGKLYFGKLYFGKLYFGKLYFGMSRFSLKQTCYLILSHLHEALTSRAITQDRNGSCPYFSSYTLRCQFEVIKKFVGAVAHNGHQLPLTATFLRDLVSPLWTDLTVFPYGKKTKNQNYAF